VQQPGLKDPQKTGMILKMQAEAVGEPSLGFPAAVGPGGTP
jgi:hypothetical protein